ncbi:hypothetical protein [Ideonella sp. BN130291]|uniref:hypothetical protein n=1 Tax=Ideonella sp. BN130291 TaxID=3112940 RepID=UPI002E2605FA|nr:hypothetical protein [Ideonella sp. BN130291]
MSLQVLSSASTQPWAAANWHDEPAAASVSFDSQVRGTQSQAIDLDFAHMAQDVYLTGSTGVQGWSRLDDTALSAAGISPDQLEDKTTGFRAAMYTDGDGHYTLAFAGSNDIPDWLNNLGQGLGLDAAQYNQAIALAKDAKLAFGDELAITGHSLGGGLAAAAALATGSPAVTFNAAGVNDNTLRRVGLDPAAAKAVADQGQIRRYAVHGEILTGAQEGVPLLKAAMPDAPGHKIELSAPPLEKPVNHWYDWLDGVALKHQVELGLKLAARPVTLHLMDAVLQSLNTDRPWLH